MATAISNMKGTDMRLFISIDFTEEVKDVLKDAVKQLRRQTRSAGFTREENLHLTLAFIGEVEEDDVYDIIEIMKHTDMKPFDISVSGSGHFGDLWWIGINKKGSLAKLADHLKKQLRDAGFDIDNKKFKPHITVARRVVPNKTHDDIKLSIPETSMTVDGFSLMKSERIDGRLTYTELFWKALG